MRKKYVYYTIALSLFTANVHSIEWLPEGKIGYFAPTGHKFRKIYDGNAIYSLELSAQAWRQLYAWGNVSYFTDSGHSIGFKNKTTIHLVPFQLGLKYLFDITEDMRIYAGLGMAPTYLNTQDHSAHVVHPVHKWGIGGVAKAGAYVNFKNFFLDFFTDYSFTKISFDGMHKHPRVYRNDADVSGWTFGLGIGYRFGSPKQAAKAKKSQHKYSEPAKPSMLHENVPEQSGAEPIYDEPESKISKEAIVEPMEPLELKVDASEYIEETQNEADSLEVKIEELLKSAFENNI